MEGVIVLTIFISEIAFYIITLMFNYKKLKRNIIDWSPKIGEALLLGIGRKYVFLLFIDDSDFEHIRQCIAGYNRTVANNDVLTFIKIYREHMILYRDADHNDLRGDHHCQYALGTIAARLVLLTTPYSLQRRKRRYSSHDAT
jgi:hypothetical protein